LSVYRYRTISHCRWCSICLRVLKGNIKDGDVTKFEFDSVWISNVFNRFAIQPFWAPCCRMRICGKILVLQLISENADKLFAQIQPTTQTTVIECATYFCSVMCYIVLIWVMILLTSHCYIKLFNWPKPLHYVPTDKINASIRIHIRSKFTLDECEFWPASSHH